MHLRYALPMDILSMLGVQFPWDSDVGEQSQHIPEGARIAIAPIHLLDSAGIQMALLYKAGRIFLPQPFHRVGASLPQ
jgi:hypothetical protein